jgi:hypothetical protein
MQEQEKIRNWRRPEEERQSVYNAEQSTGSGVFWLHVTLQSKTAIFRQSICETVYARCSSGRLPGKESDV